MQLARVAVEWQVLSNNVVFINVGFFFSLPKWNCKHNGLYHWDTCVSKLWQLWNKRDKMLEDCSSQALHRHCNIFSQVQLPAFCRGFLFLDLNTILSEPLRILRSTEAFPSSSAQLIFNNISYYINSVSVIYSTFNDWSRSKENKMSCLHRDQF